MRSLTGMEWLKKQIKELEVTNSNFKEQIQQITKIKPEVYNEFMEWTPLKLILLNYTLNICTTIINKSTFFKRKYYVDLFAGSGINKIKHKEDFLIGSPLIALLSHPNVYDSMFFCEKDDVLSNTLDLRLDTLKKKNIILIKKRYESCLDNILEKINTSNTYSFFFIDPNCMEFSWESMKKVLKLRSDIIFTFMSSEIYRAVGSAKSGIGEGETLKNFFGDNSWNKANNVDELVEIYKNNILKERPNGIIKSVKIKSEQYYFHYTLFFITNKTTGENKWLNGIEKAKKEIESNSDVAVRKAMDIVKKRQFQLTNFFKNV